jgi:Helix-turn-helix family
LGVRAGQRGVGGAPRGLGGGIAAGVRRFRHYDDAEWGSISTGLVNRGLLDRDGNVTPQGKAIRAEVEDRTDTLALSAYNALDDVHFQHLIDALVPLTRAVIATGDIPDVTPIGKRFEV